MTYRVIIQPTAEAAIEQAYLRIAVRAPTTASALLQLAASALSEKNPDVGAALARAADLSKASGAGRPAS